MQEACCVHCSTLPGRRQTLGRTAGGFLTRVPAAALALCRGGGFTLAERAFMAASWVPKVRARSHARAEKVPALQNASLQARCNAGRLASACDAQHLRQHVQHSKCGDSGETG